MKPTTGCVGSWFTWVEFRCSNWPWATYLELPCFLLFVSVSIGPECIWNGPICGVSFLELRAEDKSVKELRLPEVYLYLLAIPPLPEVAWFSSKAFQRKTIGLVQASHDPESLPQVVSLVGWGNWDWEDRASGSPTWGSCCQALNEGKVAPTPKLNHSVSARVSNSSFPLRSSLQAQVLCSLPSPLQEPPQPPWAQGDRLKEPSVGGDANPACRRGLSTSSQSQTVASRSLTP